MFLWVPTVGGFNSVLGGLVGWTMEYVSHMAGAASRIKPFHADDDTVVLHALMLLFLDPYFRYSARGMFLFCVLAPRLPPKLGDHHSFPSAKMGMNLGGSHPSLRPSLYRLWMGLSKEERKWTH